MQAKDKPIASSTIVLREEFDDWAILFDPDSGKTFGLNPTSVLIWKCLDGKHTVDDILNAIRDNCEKVSDDVEGDVKSFVQGLVEQGFAGYENKSV